MNCGFYLKVFQEFPGNGSFNLCSLFSKHGNIFVLSAWERVGKRPWMFMGKYLDICYW